MADFENPCEITIEWIKGQKVATISAYSNSRIKGKLLKLAESNADEVDVHVNEDGSCVGHVPISYVKVSPPRKISEEQRLASAERMRKLHGQFE